MIDRTKSFLLTALMAALLSPAALCAGPNLAPAPYKPLSVGTELDYGSWTCRVVASNGLETVCQGRGGDRITLLGNILALGPVTSSR